MGILKEFTEKKSNKKFDCSNLQQPEDISNQCHYKDKKGKGKNDNIKVSCCQSKEDDNTYDEMVRFLNDHFEDNDKNLYKEKILKAMCECCNKKEKNWKWKNYKLCVEKVLNESGLNVRYIEKDDIFKFNVKLFNFIND